MAWLAFPFVPLQHEHESYIHIKGYSFQPLSMAQQEMHESAPHNSPDNARLQPSGLLHVQEAQARARLSAEEERDISVFRQARPAVVFITTYGARHSILSVAERNTLAELTKTCKSKAANVRRLIMQSKQR